MKKGFTLAEILITLGIFGIVAAMTIPTLMNNIQDKQFKEAAKKAYSVASQAVQQLKMDEGGNIPSFSGNALKLVLMNYFKVMKDCGNNQCVPGSASSPIFSSLSGVGAYAYLLDDGQFIAQDGMLLCPSDNLITIDVNGYKRKPNTFGKDIFMFQLKNNVLLPMGANGTSFPVSSGYCDKMDTQNRTTMQGFGCMFYVMQGIEY